MTHAMGVILSHRRRIFCPGGKAACYCVHGALLLATSLTRSVTILSAAYRHPERVKRVEGSSHRILDTLDSLLFPKSMVRFFAFAQNDRRSTGRFFGSTSFRSG